MRKLLGLRLTLAELHRRLGLPDSVTIIDVDRQRVNRIYGDVIITIEGEGLIEVGAPIEPFACNFEHFTQQEWRSVPWPDATGLGTVREWTAAIMESGIKAMFTEDGFDPPSAKRPMARICPFGEMSFVRNGKRYNIETVVTRCEDASETLPSA